MDEGSPSLDQLSSEETTEGSTNHTAQRKLASLFYLCLRTRQASLQAGNENNHPSFEHDYM